MHPLKVKNNLGSCFARNKTRILCRKFNSTRLAKGQKMVGLAPPDMELVTILTGRKSGYVALPLVGKILLRKSPVQLNYQIHL